jgi:N utilization substance protein B
MTRKKARECAVLIGYEMGFHPSAAYDETGIAGRMDELCSEAWYEDLKLAAVPPEGSQREYILRLLRGVEAHKPELNAYIDQYAVGWKFHRVPRVAAAIMQIAMFEAGYMHEIPVASAIDAAVDLAKRYESTEIAAFVNGVLGAFVRGENLRG